jgi:uncharacterized protein (DUF2062 family)
MIHLGESPERTAFAFALGVFIAFTPTFGLHYFTALIVFWLLRLNLPALLMGTTVNNPFTIAPIYSFCLWVGLLLVGGKEPRQPIEWDRSLWDLGDLLAQLKPLFIPFVVGSLVVGTIAALLSYWLFYRLARRRWLAKQRRPPNSAGRMRGQAGSVPPPLS